MEWINRLNNAIQYIEEHILEEVDYEQLGKVACCSAYHFQRMFSYMAETSLTEYIRRRRMSLAVADLQSGEEKIIDIALKYGYSSPTAFNRAFQNVHGIAPSAVRESGVTLKSYSPISFKITIKGVEEMEYRIEKKESFRIVGIGQQISSDMEKNFKIVPPMWEKAAMDGTIPKLCGLMDSQPMGILGVSVFQEEGNGRYFIAAASTKPIDETLEEYIVPAATWAVFYGEGTSRSIQELESRILSEWFPSSGYEYGNAPDIEVYLNADPENAKYEVWIPVVKK
ncbi:MAG: AraC family transcriptional regulator [Clostridiales bacterium]|uniref:AraC family transcriptional regulator n=1 Tax=Aminipila sp. TaxID=2060095 RepID=UPI001DD4BEF6|nr:AraC family transcriptional regulator [Aminipila sp.]MBE6034770.1 AraC family transcriptional regulator [Clostridiales bacterium]